MKVIALVGDSDRGKTTTLNSLLIELLNQGYYQESYSQIGGNNDKDDFSAVLTKNGVRIGVVTVGDFDATKGINKKEYDTGCRTFVEYIEEFRNNRCHKVICTISLRLNTIENINKFLPPFNYIVYKTSSGNPSLQDFENNKDVNTILDLLSS